MCHHIEFADDNSRIPLCNLLFYMTKCLSFQAIQYEDLCARSRYQGQGQVNTPHSICGMQLHDICFWRTNPHFISIHSQMSHIRTGCWWDDLFWYANHPDVRIGTRKSLFRLGHTRFSLFGPCLWGLFSLYGSEVRGKRTPYASPWGCYLFQ